MNSRIRRLISFVVVPTVFAAGWRLGNMKSPHINPLRVGNDRPFHVLEVLDAPSGDEPMDSDSQGYSTPKSFQELVTLANGMQDAEIRSELPAILENLSLRSLESFLLESNRHRRGMEYQVGPAIQDALCKKDSEHALALVKARKVSRRLSGLILANAMRAIALVDRKRALEWVDTFEYDWMRSSAASHLGMAIGETDPTWALDYFDNLQSLKYRTQQTTLFSDWAGRSLTEAQRYYEALPEGGLKRALHKTLVSSMARHDVHAALELARASGGGNVMGDLIRVVADTDPHQAMALIESMPPGSNKLGAYSDLSSSWFQRDPEKALSWVLDIKNPMLRQELLNLNTEHVVRLGPLEAFDLAVAEMVDRDGGWLLEGTIYHASNSDLAGLIDRIETLDDELMKAKASSAILQRLAEFDIEAATTYASEMPEGPESKRALANFARVWGATDPKATLSWIEDQGSESTRDAMVKQLASAWCQVSPESAAAEIAKITDESLKRTAVTAVAQAWSFHDVGETLSWLKSMPDFHLEGAREAMTNGSYNNPVAVSEFLDEHWDSVMGADPAADAQMTESIAKNWGRYEPDKAAEWALQINDSTLRPAAVSATVGEWAKVDAMSASQWLADVPTKAIRDASVPELVQAIMQSDPESAFSWAASVEDDHQRSSLMDRIATHWAQRDLAAATEAVSVAIISEEQKETILQGLSQSRRASQLEEIDQDL